MAVNILEQPSAYIRTYDTNTTYYKINSANYNETNFSFIIKIYDGVNLLTTLKLLSDNNGYTWYNPTSYIQNYLTSNVDINTNTIVDCSNSYGEYKLDFYEEYGDPIVEYTGTTTSTKFYYNGCQEYTNYDYSDGVLHWIIANGSTDGHILSPTSTFYLDSTEKMWIYFITSGSTNFDCDFTFTLADTSTTTITYSITPTANKMYSIGAGPANLASGTTAPATWVSYTINFLNVGEDYFGSDLPVVYRKNKCQTDWTEVYWLNQDGGWSNYTFNKRKYTSYKIERSIFDKFLDYGYSTASLLTPQRQTTQYNTDVREFITLNTDWINEYENLLIKSLVFSPDVRIKEVVGGVDKLIHYNVIDSEWKQMNKQDDGLYQYEIKLIPSHKKVIQSF